MKFRFKNVGWKMGSNLTPFRTLIILFACTVTGTLRHTFKISNNHISFVSQSLSAFQELI